MTSEWLREALEVNGLVYFLDLTFIIFRLIFESQASAIGRLQPTLSTDGKSTRPSELAFPFTLIFQQSVAGEILYRDPTTAFNDGQPDLPYSFGPMVGQDPPLFRSSSESIPLSGTHIAARLQQMAEPSGILVSRTVWEQIQGKVAFPCAYLGEQPVKNIARPVRTYRVDWEQPDMKDADLGGGAPAAPGLPNKPSIVVLPFTNMGTEDLRLGFPVGSVQRAKAEEVWPGIARSYEFAKKYGGGVSSPNGELGWCKYGR
jgi:hypothetical protein